MPYCVQQKQSPIDSVRTTINSSPLEAIRDHLWLLRARREREKRRRGKVERAEEKEKDERMSWSEEREGEQKSGRGGKKEEGERSRDGKRQWWSQVKISIKYPISSIQAYSLSSQLFSYSCNSHNILSHSAIHGLCTTPSGSPTWINTAGWP